MDRSPHIPVMLDECIEALNVKRGGVYFDGTVGFGGHSSEILGRCCPGGRLIACDLDDEAVEFAIGRFKAFDGNFAVYRDNFKNFESILEAENAGNLDGVLLDLGISSFQIDNESRGFSYMSPDAPLDMRMDRSAPLTAADILNGYTEDEISGILRRYGEERFSSQIARNVVKERMKKPIETCGEFARIIEESIPAQYRQNGPCARKSFQAIRIAVNGELDGLYEAVTGLARRLKSGGRMVVLTFHSLEDRIVKQAFRMLEADCTCDKSLPVCVCGKKKEINIITKKPVTASVRETVVNPRSKSAKMRVAEKI